MPQISIKYNPGVERGIQSGREGGGAQLLHSFTCPEPRGDTRSPPVPPVPAGTRRRVAEAGRLRAPRAPLPVSREEAGAPGRQRAPRRTAAAAGTRLGAVATRSPPSLGIIVPGWGAAASGTRRRVAKPGRPRSGHPSTDREKGAKGGRGGGVGGWEGRCRPAGESHPAAAPGEGTAGAGKAAVSACPSAPHPLFPLPPSPARIPSYTFLSP